LSFGDERLAASPLKVGNSIKRRSYFFWKAIYFPVIYVSRQLCQAATRAGVQELQDKNPRNITSFASDSSIHQFLPALALRRCRG
jgi:hypothetical protein